MPEEIFRQLHGLIRSHHNRYVDEWKADGKPVIGYFCQYTPPELLLAAGALPLRMRAPGSDDSSLGDAYMSGRVCTFVRHVMTMVLEGEFDFLDGEVSVNTCDHVRRAADLFVKKSGIPFHGFVSVPRNQRESMFDYYHGELRKLAGQLEEHFGVSVTKESLNDAIKATNGVRERLLEISRLRLLERPKLTGAQALMVNVAAQVVPPEPITKMMDELIDRLRETPGLEPPRARLVLVGAELDEPYFVETLESQGGLVVADQLCYGERSVLEPIDEQAEDPLEAIGKAYFFRLSCARMMGDFPRRWDELNALVKEAKADGVVFQRLMFCDPWGADQHNIMHRLQKNPVFPLLALTREYGITPTGQVKTRMQAFIEKIEIGRAQRADQGGVS